MLDSKVPHFVSDYRKLAKDLTAQMGHEAAMHLGVGVEYEVVGKIEAALLRQLGLKEGDFVVDVGCGSGRLSSALSRGPHIAYHGTDVVQEFLDYAKSHSADHYQFTLVDGLYVPEETGVADFVTLFSVATHLHLHETYTYLKELIRVAKPGGLIVVSFLDPTNPAHWPMFEATAYHAEIGALVHLNAFIEPVTIKTFADHLGVRLEAMHPAGDLFIKLDEPLIMTTGQQTYTDGVAELGQSVAIMRKPAA